MSAQTDYVRSIVHSAIGIDPAVDHILALCERLDDVEARLVTLRPWAQRGAGRVWADLDMSFADRVDAAGILRRIQGGTL